MFKYYWETIIHHQHDIMVPIFIVYCTAMYFIGKWFIRNEFKKLREDLKL